MLFIYGLLLSCNAIFAAAAMGRLVFRVQVNSIIALLLPFRDQKCTGRLAIIAITLSPPPMRLPQCPSTSRRLGSASKVRKVNRNDSSVK